MKQHIPEAYKKYLNKRVLTVGAICMLLAAAVITNVVVNNRAAEKAKAASGTSAAQETAVTEASSKIGFFASYREERDNVRTQELAYLDAIVSQGADEATLSDAQKQKLDLINCMELELTVENLVRGKGFDADRLLCGKNPDVSRRCSKWQAQDYFFQDGKKDFS